MKSGYSCLKIRMIEAILGETHRERKSPLKRCL